MNVKVAVNQKQLFERRRTMENLRNMGRMLNLSMTANVFLALAFIGLLWFTPPPVPMAAKHMGLVGQSQNDEAAAVPDVLVRPQLPQASPSFSSSSHPIPFDMLGFDRPPMRVVDVDNELGLAEIVSPYGDTFFCDDPNVLTMEPGTLFTLGVEVVLLQTPEPASRFAEIRMPSVGYFCQKEYPGR